MKRSSVKKLFRNFFVPFGSVSFCLYFGGLILMGALAPTSPLFWTLTSVFGVSLFEKTANGGETAEDFILDSESSADESRCDALVRFFWAIYVACFAMMPGLFVAIFLFDWAGLAVQTIVIFSSVFLFAPILVLSGMLNDGSPFNILKCLGDVFETTRENKDIWIKYYLINIAFLIVSATTLAAMSNILIAGREANEIGSNAVFAVQIAFGAFLTCSTFFYSRLLGRFAAALSA